MTANININPPLRGPTGQRGMHPMRRISLAAGILYVLTFVSIPTLALYKGVKDDAGAFVLGAGSTAAVQWGALSEVIVGLAGIGTAVVLYPVAKRVSQTAALGFVAARLVETCLIFVSVVSLLSITTLRNDVAGTAGTDSASLVTMSHGLVATYNWTFLLSQSLMPVACDLLLGYVLFRSALVPRILPMVAFVGAPLLLASDIAVFFGAYPQVSPIAVLAALPVAVFELSLGVWLITKGFKPTALTAGHP
ncbi:hypothetical protein QFZ60_001771 [Arthrobacter sp. B2I5]|uniref:DUF4386 domain-containing protein n=1 Tax=Arthrobacter sp. B2I5 TaxID=3042266 RepID=UPI002789D5F6|nr:DUF4386 domain-containing protein [Arthrobacter sp. B2I5]MDQ0825598.1 hypothetical protein [Arthrobacter sp. B2I5]